jgi:hypothetical protein
VQLSNYLDIHFGILRNAYGHFVGGTFFICKFKGILLVAIANYANNRLLLLAFSLVATENNDKWKWFIHILRTKYYLV